MEAEGVVKTSLQLQCDRKQITAHVGGDFLLTCSYDTSRYLYSKKYWCRGNSRETCEILVDSERRTQTKSTHRSHVKDARRRGLFVKVTHLQSDDSGVYWVGIDKIYADIMTSVKVVVTEGKNITFVSVPVSKPSLWPLSSLINRPTCWGQPVTVRCGCARGTGIRYTWYHEQTVLHHSSDLKLHCGAVKRDSSDYYCVAENAVSSLESGVLSVQVLMPADSGCIYVINIQGQPVYDCADRMSTTTTATTPSPTTTPSLTTCQATMKTHTDTRNYSFPINQTDQEQLFSRPWMGMPFWYTLLRCISFASLLMFLIIVLRCTKARHKRAKRKRPVRFRHLAQ
uniref:uncharacterized protein n=1 Tax=Semicossyphus pulcher TaxID=241346 RepID=UPI0037E83812